MVPTWPSTLPQALLRDGYSQALANVTIRSVTDIGPAMVRRRATAGVVSVAGSMWMTRAQLSTLVTFYNTHLLGGAHRFAWKDPVTDAPVEMRFTEPPAWSAIGADFAVNLQLEILP